MNESSAGVCLGILELDIKIKQTLERSPAKKTSRLFSENSYASFPVLTIKDSILEPIDKLVWMVIRLQVHEAGGDTKFPGYESIARTVNVVSSATISRALTILRLTRWLTLCSKYSDRDKCSRMNIYTVHDNPLSLADTNYLDDSYHLFLHESAQHYHARVKKVAESVVNELNRDAEGVCDVENPIPFRVSGAEGNEKGATRHFFSYSSLVMNTLCSNSLSMNHPGRPVQNLMATNHGVQNLKPAIRKWGESCPQNLKATSNTGDSSLQNLKEVNKTESALVYPRRLSEKQREVTDNHLSRVPVEKRQYLLDEMEGRIRAEKLGMPPLYDDLSFLNTLCNALLNGTFKFNLGIKVEESRQAKKRAELEKFTDLADQSDSEKLKELRREIIAGRGPLADIRKILGMRNSSAR